ncbi:MAG: sulfatase-like hydrolase/transferase [Ilumatobacteraceae bacterium]
MSSSPSRSADAAATGYVSLPAPVRVLDTRAEGATVDGQFSATGIQAYGSTLPLSLAGRAGIPVDAGVVVLNVTVTEAAGDGFITVFPCGAARPISSNLNYVTGQTVANLVIAKVGISGAVCLFNVAATHFVVDVTGYFPGVETFTPLVAPARLFDSRSDGVTVDGRSAGGGIVAAGTSAVVQIDGRAAIPTGVASAVLNVTVAEPETAGFVTVYPCGTMRPNASNLNYVIGQTVPNAVIARLGSGGTVCVFTSATAHLIVDVAGYVATSSVVVPLPSPARLLDTRADGTTADGQFVGIGLRGAGTTTPLTVADRAPIPANASVVVNVTVDQPTQPGFVTVFPAGVARPNASNLNYVTGQTVPNAVISRLGSDGTICLFNSGSTHLIVDVTAYIVGSSPPGPGTACGEVAPPPTSSPTTTGPASPSTTTSTSTTTTTAPPSGGRPNVLLINMDDARFDALTYMPKTAAWMASGVTYPNNYVTIPSCCPSRSTLFTGRYSHNNGIEHQGEALLLDQDFTMAHYLDAAGYRTAMAGKFLLSWPDATAPPDFDRHTVIKGGYTNYTARVDGVAQQVSQYSTTFLGSALRGYVHGFESNDAQPWFAYFAPQAPHIEGGWKTLAVPEAKYASAPVGNCVQPGEPDKSDKPPHMSWVVPDPAYVLAVCQSQARALMSVDDEIDAMLTQLTADGELGNTIVIVTSDNGFLWGDHDRWEKFVAYEPSVRVPLLVRWDGHLSPGIDTRRTETIDLLPTILEAAGITPLKPLDGRSLFSAIPRAENFAEYWYDNDANGPTPSWASLSNGVWKYIETYDESGNLDFVEYYRLQSDPLELTNVLQDGNPANDPSANELSQLAQRLAAARVCFGGACP